MRFGVVVFPGSNCEMDCFHVIDKVLMEEVDYVWHQQTDVSDYDCLVLPGGFSYGDYLRCGAIARFSPVMEAVASFAREGGLVIGICNGFQILLEAGLLPGAMLRNTSLSFVCRFVNVRVDNADSPWTNSMRHGTGTTHTHRPWRGQLYRRRGDPCRPGGKGPDNAALLRRGRRAHRGIQPQRVRGQHRGYLQRGL